MRTPLERSVFGLMLLMLGPGGRAVAQHPSPRYTSAHGEPLAGGRPECPEDGRPTFTVVDSVGDSLVTHKVTSVPLSEPITPFPEFHDCQRFILSLDPPTYDSLYAIFAAFRLQDRLRSLRGGALKDSASTESGTRVPTVSVATIYTDAVRGYAPLGIQYGFNCLFLYHKGDTLSWGALMVPLKPPANDCLKDSLPLSGGKNLEVVTIPSGDDNLADYPEVARWDWDSASSQQYIGIMCGAAWCEVGAEGFHPSAAFPDPGITFQPVGMGVPGVAASTLAAKRVTKIKGWYDAQYLADSTGLAPSRVWGVIVPNPELVGIETPKVYLNRWVNVGAVIVDADYKGPIKKGVNQIFFCLGHARGCAVPVTAPRVPPKPYAVTLDLCEAKFGWWAKLIPADGSDPRYTCVRFTDHTAALAAWSRAHGGVHAPIPATARFRWLLRDEATGWFGCKTSSCCVPN